ncbi:hypothetical protein DV736_g1827, partial [Chaetothyriales sp. CBS 134916]
MALAASPDLAFSDHQSLDATLSDYEEQERHFPDLPSQHSGFRSANESDVDAASNGSSAPCHRAAAGAAAASGWFSQDPYGRFTSRCSSPSRSRQTSPEYEDADEGDHDVTIPASIPLPVGADSPVKERSPEPEVRPAAMPLQPDGGDDIHNYIRFALRAEVQHREPFVALVSFLRAKFDALTATKSTTCFSILMFLLSLTFTRVLLAPPTPPPLPDLVKLSTLAKSFEPLIFYSENGYSQITALQETSVAVWDLGESVRSANMTSAPLIVKSLDDLSDSLKTLGLELTRFFADVDADVDSILIVMDWAKRELLSLSSPAATSSATLVFDAVHSLLNRAPGLLTNSRTGDPTTLGDTLTRVLGASSSQRARTTVTRTFYEFLNVLEESINSELTHSTLLFTLFEAIDRQFLNLQRTVVRETDTQERLEGEMLSSLWTRVVGADPGVLRKYERNKQLLATVRSRTVSNKHLLVEHHGRLQTLKVNLETLRRKLVSPLIKRNDSLTLGANGSHGAGALALQGLLDAQVQGLERTYVYLRDVRESQKSKLLEMVYGAKASKSGSRLVITGGEDGGSGGLEIGTR